MNTASLRICMCAISVGMVFNQLDAQVLYDIDFSVPEHVVGNAASTDLGPVPRIGPSTNNFDAPVIVESFGSFLNGAAFFRSETVRLSQMGLSIEQPLNGVGVDVSRYLLEFDLIIEQMGGAFDSFDILFDTPQVSRFEFRGDGLIQIGNGADFIGTFDFGVVQHVEVLADIDSQWWSIAVNGEELFAGVMQSDATMLNSIRLGIDDRNGFDTHAYVDNIVVTAIPTPAVATIMVPALLLIYRRQRRSCQKLPS